MSLELEITIKKIWDAKKFNTSEVNLSYLKLEEIPPDIIDLDQIKALYLSNNQITEIKNIEQLTQLTKLDLRNNQITEINGLEKLTTLNKLDLSGNQITKIKGLETLTQLTKLYLTSNQITEINGLEQLTHLTTLFLSGNQITEIKGLEQLIYLTKLDLSGNQITEIKGLEQLTQLTILNLSDNQLTEIKGLEKLTQLTTLFLSGNKLTEIKGLEQLTHLTKLDLRSNQLTEIKGLEQLTQLIKLDLKGNQLTEIKGLEKLTQLTTLNLSENQITEIKGLEQLTQLTDLRISDSKLIEINGLDNLININYLFLSGNQITEIKGLEKIEQLIGLDLSNNQLTEIKNLDKLTKLFILDLSRNQLKEIKDLEKLARLKRLSLFGNQFSEIPEYLLKLGQPIYWDDSYHTDGIHLESNPFTNPPPEVIQQGNEAIQEYFNQRKKAGEELLSEAKLILLGDGRSGKTSLANRLLNKGLPKEADRTQGVDIVIGEYNFPLINNKSFKINIWDFAGQDKYKTLHQLFYTDSSLYVMVAESGNMTTDFDDWFQTAQLFGEGSPLILILNEFKEGIGMGSFDVNYWKKQFPNLLKEVITVNLGSKKNFDDAEEYICFLAQTLPHTKYTFPSNWAGIRRILNERRYEQYITLTEYLKICSENNLSDRESALVLSSVLHKIGVCLHYQKNQLLKQYIILKNEWATDAVYKVLEDKIVVEEKSGFFDWPDMERIWSNSEYSDMRPQLLELMKQFKLAYQLPGKDEYVTPPLLPPAIPKSFIWPNEDSLELYIEYEFLPKALLTQFIVTRHADIAEGRTLVWRYGVILKWENEALAEVARTKLQGRDAFRIRTQGNNRRGMMTVILKTFRALHEDYKGIKYTEKVPCICNGCKTEKNTQHYFDFDYLQFRLKNERYDVECEKSLETVNVMELLENSFVFEKFKEGNALQLKNDVGRKSSSQISVLNLFLASSKELTEEREKIGQSLSRKNKVLRKQGFLIELLIWEDNNYIGKSLRSQDNYNLDIEQANLFMLMFYSKIGKYTLEEFETAKSLFDKTNMPRMYIFQKDIDLPKSQSKSDADSRYEFLERLKEMENFPILFQNTDMLINNLDDVIDNLLQDKDFIKDLKAK